MTTLQQALLSVVPTHEIFRCNLKHLLGKNNRFVEDLSRHRLQDIPQWFLCLLLDTGDTSFHWFSGFIHKKAHYLQNNRAMFVGFQERCHKKNSCMNMFAMRVSVSHIVVFVYMDPYIKKGGIYYQRYLPENIMNNLSDRWGEDDWGCLSMMELECMFTIQSIFTSKNN